MRLAKVNIENFRSIADITIDFETSCRVLVGVNESGKTNILKALSLLDSATVPKPDDLRESLPNEEPIEEGFVRFIFALDKLERAKAWENILSKVLADEREPLVTTGGKF